MPDGLDVTRALDPHLISVYVNDGEYYTADIELLLMHQPRTVSRTLNMRSEKSIISA